MGRWRFRQRQSENRVVERPTGARGDTEMAKAPHSALLFVCSCVVLLSGRIASAQAPSPDLTGCTLRDRNDPHYCARCDWDVSLTPPQGTFPPTWDDHGGVGDKLGWITKKCPGIAPNKAIIVEFADGSVTGPPGTHPHNPDLNCFFGVQIESVNEDGSGEEVMPPVSRDSGGCGAAGIARMATTLPVSYPSGAIRVAYCRDVNMTTIYNKCTLQGRLSIYAIDLPKRN